MIWDFAGYGGQVAIRDGKWKAVRRRLNRKPSAWELYDLRSDRTESHDIAVDHPEIIKRLEEAYLADRSVEPDFPNRTYDPLTKPTH